MGKYLKRNVAGFICLSLLTGILSGCSGKTVNKENKTVITTLYISDFPQMEELVESVYPDIDLQCEIMPYTTELLRRLQKNAGPDLVISTQPSSQEIHRYLLDISDSSASSAYDGTIMKPLMVDGKSYLLPLPGQYSGYIINETLFAQAGLPLPTTNQELLSSLTILKEQGIGIGEDNTNFAIQSDYFSDIGMYYVGYMVPDFLGLVKGVEWLADFREKKAAVQDSWGNMFSLTDRLIENNLLDPAPIGRQRNSIRCSQRMGNGTLAAVFGNSTLFSKCQTENKALTADGNASEYTYRMLPFFSDEGNEPWIIFSPSAYIGINAESSEEKQDACRKILELISTQEGQDAIIKDLQMGASCLRDYKSDGSYLPVGVEEYVESGYIYNVNFPDKIIEYLGSNIQKMMAGEMTKTEVLEAVDAYYYQGSETVDYNLSVIGTVEQDLLLQNFNVRRGETELGNFLADCTAEISGASIAVVNGGNIRSSLYAGEIYGEDLEALFPFENHIVILEMDGKTLWDMLENSVAASSDEFPGGRFLQISGLKYTFDSSKPVGDRLQNVVLPDGSSVGMGSSYQVAVTDYMAGSVGYAEGNGDGYTMLNCYDDTIPKGNVTIVEETGFTYKDALKNYFEKHQTPVDNVKTEGRITDLAQK